MPALTLNPGFVPLIGALLVLALPRSARGPVLILSALAALWLLLDREFGAAAAMAQMGLPVVLLNLDALNRIFGIAMVIALIAIGIFAGGRRNRYEDAAILLLSGGAICALFVGDLVSFVAAASLAGLAAAWVVFASPMEGAGGAGARLLIWHGLEGLLFLVGVAFHLSAGAAGSVFARLDVTSIGGAFIFCALMIRVGAPFAHVWLKDVVAHASSAGAAALTAFTTMLGVYALARLFPSEPLLVPIGAAMTVLGLMFACAEDDLRRAAAYAFGAQTGLCVALVGIGTPMAMAAAEGHAFAALVAFVAMQLTLGAIVERAGAARLSSLAGLGRRMPISALLLLGCGLAASAVPGLATYATHSVMLDATSQWEVRWLWLLIAVTPAVVFASLFCRVALAAYTRELRPQPMQEAPFVMLLGSGLALFFCVSIGLAPGWLYNLMPANIEFQPFALDRVAPQLQLLGGAGLTYVVLHVTRIVSVDRPIHLLDVDAFYRGPVAGGGRWAGVLALRLYGAWREWTARLAASGVSGLGRLTAACDRPYETRSAASVTFACLSAILLAMLLIH